MQCLFSQDQPSNILKKYSTYERNYSITRTFGTLSYFIKNAYETFSGRPRLEN